MKCCLKIVLFTMLIAAIMGASGCSYQRKTAPPQPESTQKQPPKQQNTPAPVPTPKKLSAEEDKMREKVLLDAPIISQKPELKDGCEVSSLAMLLQYAGVRVDKMTLAKKVKKDPSPIVQDNKGDIEKWGDPSDGFVGDITGKKKGFAVYHEPLLRLLEEYLPGRGLDLTGRSFEDLLKNVNKNRPVIVWATIDFRLPDKYEKWNDDGKVIRATFDEHAVLLVGYDSDHVYVNNPYNGVKEQKVSKDAFKKAWDALGSQAITYK